MFRELFLITRIINKKMQNGINAGAINMNIAKAPEFIISFIIAYNCNKKLTNEQGFK